MKFTGPFQRAGIFSVGIHSWFIWAQNRQKTKTKKNTKTHKKTINQILCPLSPNSAKISIIQEPLYRDQQVIRPNRKGVSYPGDLWESCRKKELSLISESGGQVNPLKLAISQNMKRWERLLNHCCFSEAQHSGEV